MDHIVNLSQNNLKSLILQGFEDCIVFDDLLDKHKGDLGKYALFTKDQALNDTCTVKPVFKWPLKNRQNKGLKAMW